MAVERHVGWWWGSLYDATAVVGYTFALARWGRGLGNQIPEIEHTGSVSGCIRLHVVGLGAVVLQHLLPQ